MSEDVNALVMELGKEFMGFILREVPAWDRAYLRCEFDVGMTCVTSIWVSKQEVPSFMGIDDFELSDKIDNLFYDIHKSLKSSDGKDLKVCLVRVTDTYDFKMYFEFDDIERWPIPDLNNLKLTLLPRD